MKTYNHTCAIYRLFKTDCESCAYRVDDCGGLTEDDLGVFIEPDGAIVIGRRKDDTINSPSILFETIGVRADDDGSVVLEYGKPIR